MVSGWWANRQTCARSQLVYIYYSYTRTYTHINTATPKWALKTKCISVCMINVIMHKSEAKTSHGPQSGKKATRQTNEMENREPDDITWHSNPNVRNALANDQTVFSLHTLSIKQSRLMCIFAQRNSLSICGKCIFA